MDSNKGRMKPSQSFHLQGYHPRSSSDANLKKAIPDCVKPRERSSGGILTKGRIYMPKDARIMFASRQLKERLAAHSQRTATRRAEFVTQFAAKQLLDTEESS